MKIPIQFNMNNGDYMMEDIYKIISKDPTPILLIMN